MIIILSLISVASELDMDSTVKTTSQKSHISPGLQLSQPLLQLKFFLGPGRLIVIVLHLRYRGSQQAVQGGVMKVRINIKTQHIYCSTPQYSTRTIPNDPFGFGTALTPLPAPALLNNPKKQNPVRHLANHDKIVVKPWSNRGQRTHLCVNECLGQGQPQLLTLYQCLLDVSLLTQVILPCDAAFKFKDISVPDKVRPVQCDIELFGKRHVRHTRCPHPAAV